MKWSFGRSNVCQFVGYLWPPSGMVGHGLNALSGALALVCGVSFAGAAWLGTSDPDKPGRSGPSLSKYCLAYGKIWFWLVAAFCRFVCRAIVSLAALHRRWRLENSIPK